MAQDLQDEINDINSLWVKVMIKSEIIAKMCEKMPNLSEKKISDGVNEIIEQMTSTLCENRRIEIRGFGSFELHYRRPRKAHNPRTRERLLTEPKYSPHFKPGKLMKERVDASKDRIGIREDIPEPTAQDDEDSSGGSSSSGNIGANIYLSKVQY